jgi:AAA domain
VLTGPAGAGKTTVAALLAAALDPPSVHLHADDFWHFIKRGYIVPYLPGSHRQNEVIIGVLAAAAFGYAAGGYQVICDGVVGPWFLAPFRDQASATGLPLHYVILRPDEATTLSRATGRTGQALTDPEPVLSLHRQFTELAELEPHALDSTGQSAADTTQTVRHGVAAGSYLLPVR